MKIAIPLICLLFITISCGTYKSQTQIDKYSYLQLVGEVNGEKLILDNGTAIKLGESTESFDLNGRTVTKIRIERGKHIVKITRNNEIIINRTFFVSSGNVFEMELP
ncbi:MAG: hypothetical protein BM556_16805 [Bacteriovorax sp. MedPE-SWde]|nr:MAG: hypothetical protein BM556_16805 [Bacteriovorax sp. MedPE-SWde]